MATGKVIGTVTIRPNHPNAYGRFGDRVRLVEGRYADGRVAVAAISLATGHRGSLSADRPGANLEPGEFIVDGYDEPICLADAAKAAGLFTDTGRRVRIRLVHYPVWRLR